MTTPTDVQWLEHIAAQGECIQPYQVGDGQYVRCGTRDATVCPGCAELYAKDASARIRSGIFDPPPGQQPAGYLFLTLTAPSFGRVHYVPSHGGKRRPCGCGGIHDKDDSKLRGVPLSSDDYDYENLVRWNNGVGVLWDSTRRRLERLLGEFDYVVVREWQLRGVLHLHVILRLRIPALAPLVLDAARSSTATVPWSGHHMTWGEQGDCQALSLATKDGAREAARTIWYVAKALGYSLKALTTGLTRHPTEHFKRLIVASRYISCGAEGCVAGRVGNRPCRAAPHRKYGSRERAIHMSRTWSWTGLTQSSQREARRAWAREHADEAGSQSAWRRAQWLRSEAVGVTVNLGLRAERDDDFTAYGVPVRARRVHRGFRRHVDRETGEIQVKEVVIDANQTWQMPPRPPDYDDGSWASCCAWWQEYTTPGERAALRLRGLPPADTWLF